MTVVIKHPISRRLSNFAIEVGTMSEARAKAAELQRRIDRHELN